MLVSIEKLKINFIINLVFGILLVVTGANLFYKAYIHHEWMIGDWLINYHDSAGFKRRGLMGSFVFLIQDFTGAPLAGIVFFIQMIFYLIFYLFLRLFLLSFDNRSLLFFLLILLTPLGIGAYIGDFMYIGRKDVIVLTFFTYALNKGKSNYSFLIYLVILLVHESVIFLMPFFVYFEIINNQKRWHYVVFCYVTITLFYLLLIYSNGIELAADNTRVILEKRGFLNFGGPFTWKEKAIDYISLRYNFFAWSLIPIAFAYFIMLNILTLVEIQKRKHLLLLLALTTVTLIPLFLNGIDWGRWIHMFFVIFVLFTMSVLRGTNFNNALRPKHYTIIIIAIILGLFFQNGIITPRWESYWVRWYYLIVE